MRPWKEIPSLSLIHIGLLPSLRLSFMPSHHPFPPLSLSALTECVRRWSINRSATPRQQLGEWWAGMTFFLSLFPSLFHCLAFPLVCRYSNYSTWKTWNVSLPATDLLASQLLCSSWIFRLSLNLQHSGSVNLKHHSLVAHFGSSSHQETQLLSYCSSHFASPLMSSCSPGFGSCST